MLKKFFNRIKFSLYVLLLLLIPAIYAHQEICIVIPAYNEATRIEHTLEEYAKYFEQKPEKTTFLVVANNCKDNTVAVAKAVAKKHKNIKIIDLKPGGKGFAIKQGFLWTLKSKIKYDLIGFVDADMATLPQYYYDLIKATKNHDGAIASRYMKSAIVHPKRPWGKKMGGKLYNWMLRAMFGLKYKDTQCGAKIFNYDTIAKVAPFMSETGWSFDLELLYLCKLFEKDVVEIPTTWSDQPGSHLIISSKLAKEFLNSPKRIKQRHLEQKQKLKQEKLARKKQERLNKTKQPQKSLA
ncbi:glycosyltransferase [Candidatus Babeliales bacterium]|nr:glycosyltransferase [Candidatus Babeliales bacterium]